MARIVPPTQRAGRDAPAASQTLRGNEPDVQHSIERLSPRERAIVELVAQGRANKQIAAALDPPCKEETVKAHLRNIYAKLGVANRAEAVAAWVRYGGH